MQTRLSSDVEGTDGVPLSYYFRALGRWWWVIAACTVLGVLIGIGYWLITPSRATATSVVSVNVISTDPFSSSRAASALLDGAAEAQIAGSYVVADAAAKKLDNRFTAAEIRESLDIQSVVDTTIIRISSTMSNDEDAAETADAVADAYLAYRSEQATERIQNSLAQSNQRLDSLREELRAVNQKLSDAAPGSGEAAEAETDRSLLTLEISSLLNQAATTENIDTTGGTILNPASRNDVAREPKASVVVLAGLLGGLGIGVLLAFVISAADTRVRSGEDVRSITNRPIIGTLSTRTATLPAQGIELAELRAIRERISADRRFDPRGGVCSIVDVGAGDVTEMAVNLAYVFARAGSEVEFIGLGLSDAYTARIIEAFALEPRATSDQGVRFTSSTTPGFSLYRPTALDMDESDDDLPDAAQMEIQTRRADTLIVLSVPANAALATRLATNRLSDATVAVVAFGETRRRALKSLAHDVDEVGGTLLGNVTIERRRSLPAASASPTAGAGTARRASSRHDESNRVPLRTRPRRFDVERA